MGKAHFCALVSPIYRTWGSPPEVSEDNFLELREAKRDIQAGLGRGSEKYSLRQAGGERGASGLQWLAAWGPGTGVCDFTLQEVGLRGRCGRLVASDGRPAATWGWAG